MRKSDARSTQPSRLRSGRCPKRAHSEKRKNNVITHETLRELLTIERMESYLQGLPAGSEVGIAEDEDSTAGGDWAYDNVIARYLRVQLPISAVTVDYSGITISGECEEMFYDSSLAWVEYLLRVLDAMLAGTRAFRYVSKEQVLACLKAFTILENSWSASASAETPQESILLDLGNGYALRYGGSDPAGVPYLCVSSRDGKTANYCYWDYEELRDEFISAPERVLGALVLAGIPILDKNAVVNAVLAILRRPPDASRQNFSGVGTIGGRYMTLYIVAIYSKLDPAKGNPSDPLYSLP